MTRENTTMSGTGLIEREKISAEQADDDGGADDRRLVITLSGEAAASTRLLAERLGISAPEAVRRGLNLLDLWAGLDDHEELVVRNGATGVVERLRFHWGF
jgi:hypothetical protein